MLVKLKKSSLLILILLGGGFIPVGAETFRIDGIYLVVNNQMLTRSEAIDTSKTLKTRIEQSNLSAGEKSKRLAELKNDLLKSLVQELLLLDRADALGLIRISAEENLAQSDFSKAFTFFYTILFKFFFIGSDS